MGAANGCATSLPMGTAVQSTGASLSPIGEETPCYSYKGWQKVLSPCKKQEDPQPCPGKAWSPWLLAWRPWAGPGLQWGSASSSHTEGRKAQPCSILLMDISVVALLHKHRGWAGELTIKPGKIVKPVLVPHRALWEVPVMSAGDSPWSGAALGKASGKCL